MSDGTENKESRETEKMTDGGHRQRETATKLIHRMKNDRWEAYNFKCGKILCFSFSFRTKAAV